MSILHPALHTLHCCDRRDILALYCRLVTGDRGIPPSKLWAAQFPRVDGPRAPGRRGEDFTSQAMALPLTRCGIASNDEGATGLLITNSNATLFICASAGLRHSSRCVLIRSRSVGADHAGAAVVQRPREARAVLAHHAGGARRKPAVCHPAGPSGRAPPTAHCPGCGAVPARPAQGIHKAFASAHRLFATQAFLVP